MLASTTAAHPPQPCMQSSVHLQVQCRYVLGCEQVVDGRFRLPLFPTEAGMNLEIHPSAYYLQYPGRALRDDAMACVTPMHRTYVRACAYTSTTAGA